MRYSGRRINYEDAKEHLRRHREMEKKREELLKSRLQYYKEHHEFHKHKEEMHRYFRYYKVTRPVAILINLLIIFLLYRFIGIKALAVVFLAFFVAKETGQFLFFRHLERRILKPIDKLRNGVEEIAKGNYDINIENVVPNEIGLLIESFNAMAAQLKEGERLKNEYEENRKTLIANISHDLKTPITSIQGYIEAILDSDMPAENMNKYLKTIYNNSAYINKLIDDLFLFSKLDMQKLDFHFESLNIKAFMADLMEEFTFELEEQKAGFAYNDLLEGEYKVSMDRKRLHQAVRNIIGNAVKYGPEDELEIDVDMYDCEGMICIDINDNGPGIPEDKLIHIFDRFYRLDTERTKDLSSTGLGLAIARELIEAHGGEISVESQVGQGSCFRIILPIEGKQEVTCNEANIDN